MERELSYGENAVGVTFNPSKNPNVDTIKGLYAEIIEHLAGQRAQSNNSEQARLLSIAITEAQGACMWAVKGLTWEV